MRPTRAAFEANPAWRATLVTRTGGVLCILAEGRGDRFLVWPVASPWDSSSDPLSYDRAYIDRRIAEGRYRLDRGELP